MAADPFSDILRFISAETVVSGGFTAGGPWAIRFPAMDKISFSAVTTGGYWLRLDKRKTAVRIHAGDVCLLAPKQSFVLASDLDAPMVEAAAVFANADAGFAHHGKGEDCIQIGGFVRLDPASGDLLTDVLPPLIHIRAASPEADPLQQLLQQLTGERDGERPGASMVSAQLAQLIFVLILRAYLEQPGPKPAGWLRAVSDSRLAPALRLMHGEPGRPWQLGDLARAAGMSRTTFAARFKQVAGVAPLAYLTDWRMRLAQRALREADTPMSVLAPQLGYASESAFSNAFKRATGLAPRNYRTQERERASA